MPIWIGPAEARAIQVELEGQQSPRPLSHDLLITLIATMRGRVTRVVVNDLLEGTFYATIDIDTPRGMRHIDARPSDAIAVAVRAKCPLFVDGGALEALGGRRIYGCDFRNRGREATKSWSGFGGCWAMIRALQGVRAYFPHPGFAKLIHPSPGGRRAAEGIIVRSFL